ncbi:hypothetical protein [Pseudomonas sp. CP4]|uniref:hypothetical protein n=1 Tax=Pseudomonas sp. CP4 TaxID=3388844 RepID=UPI0039EFA6F8
MSDFNDSTLSSTWLQEFMPFVNGQRVSWADVKLDLIRGESCTLALDYEYSWLIGDTDALIALEHKSGPEPSPCCSEGRSIPVMEQNMICG